MSIAEQANEAADQVIAGISESGGADYSAARADIADLFNNSLWDGNWDATTDLSGLRNLRFIQEDEYDQHMDDDDDKPTGEICLAAGYYIFYASL